MLKGLGAAVALPFLDAMEPALAAPTASRRNFRLVCIEMVHGSAGSSAIGIRKNLWAPAATGRDFDLSPTSLQSLEPFREHLTIVSNTDCSNADPYDAKEIGGDHWRSSAVFLTQAHPKHTAGPDVEAGTSIDQLYARRFGQDTPIPSMQLCIEPVDQGGGCGFGYSCTYADTISWASPTRPLPMVRDPRVVFEMLFGALRLGQEASRRLELLAEDRSLLDRVMTSTKRLSARLGPSDRARLNDYLDNVREVERRIQNIETYNRSGEFRELPQAPDGIPDSFSAHVKLMFDLQALALASDVTRVFAFKLGRDNSNRVYPESGFGGAFHPTSHHSGKEEKILNFARLNTFHVSLVPYFLERLKSTKDGEGRCSTTPCCCTVHRWAIPISTTIGGCHSSSSATRAARLPGPPPQSAESDAACRRHARHPSRARHGGHQGVRRQRSGVRSQKLSGRSSAVPETIALLVSCDRFRGAERRKDPKFQRRCADDNQCSVGHGYRGGEGEAVEHRPILTPEVFELRAIITDGDARMMPRDATVVDEYFHIR